MFIYIFPCSLGALRRAAGAAWMRESEQYVHDNGTIDDGQVAVTSAGLLAAHYVVHAVGPIWRDGNVCNTRETYTRYILLFCFVFSVWK